MKNKTIDFIDFKLIDEACRYWVLSKSMNGQVIRYVEGSITILDDGRISWTSVFFNNDSEKFPDRIFSKEEFTDGLINTHSIVRKNPNVDGFNYIAKNIVAREEIPGGLYLSHIIPILIVNCGGAYYACEEANYFKTSSDIATEKKFLEEENEPSKINKSRKIRFLKWYTCEKIKDREFFTKRITYDGLYLFQIIPVFKKNIKVEKRRKETSEYESD